MARLRSEKPVKTLEEIVLPYEVVFPISGQVSVNKAHKEWKKGQVIILTFPEYVALVYSSYAEYLN